MKQSFLNQSLYNLTTVEMNGKANLLIVIKWIITANKDIRLINKVERGKLDRSERVNIKGKKLR